MNFNLKKLRANTLKSSILWHNRLLWVGGLSLIMFALSGLTHPIMTRTGPKAAEYFPPQAKILPNDLSNLSKLISDQNPNSTRLIKVLPSAPGLVVQMSGDISDKRRYFDLKSGNEIPNYDKEHAVWLARYYSGDDQSQVKEIVWQTEFSDAYPWVNRLLPVYRISFDRSDGLTLFIHTETNALGGIVNDYKVFMQSIFRNLHTWVWLERFENIRVISLGLLIVCLFALAVTGFGLLIVLKHRRKMPQSRFIHRCLSYAVVLPLLGFSASGFYHLVQSSYRDSIRGFQLTDELNFKGKTLASNFSWQVKFSDSSNFNQVSLIQGPEDSLLYRLSLSKGKRGEKVTRQARFDGVPIEKGAIYINAETGLRSSTTDLEMAKFHAQNVFGYQENQLIGHSLVTYFSHKYDFRNKRLPVWQLDYDTKAGDSIFIDPVTATLVDRTQWLDRAEGLSFSMLHKWNILVPVMGRLWRDNLVMIMLLLILAVAGLGFSLVWQRHRAKI